MLVCILAATSVARTITSARSGVWTAPSTWVGGIVPSASDAVVIAKGHTVTADGSGITGSYGTVSIEGNLASDDGGMLNFGSKPVTIAGDAPEQTIAGFQTKGLISVTKKAGVAVLTGNVDGSSITINAPGGTIHLGSGLTHTFTGIIICLRGTVDCGSSTLTIAGEAGGIDCKWIPGSGTVNFTSNFLQIIPPIAYHHLCFSGSGVKEVFTGSALKISGDWVVNSRTVLMGNADAEVAGSISGTGAITLGKGTIAVEGDWTNSGVFRPGDGTVVYSGAGPQTVGAAEYHNLTFDKPSGMAVLGGTVTVHGALKLRKGIVSATEPVLLILDSTGRIEGGSERSYLNGTCAKYVDHGADKFTFPIGDEFSYAPVRISFEKVKSGGLLKASTRRGVHPQMDASGNDPWETSNRYWTLAGDGLVFDSYTAHFRPDLFDVPKGAQKDITVKKYSDHSWSDCSSGSVDGAGVQTVALTSFGDFVVGMEEPSAPFITVNAKALLAGAYSRGIMSTSLRSQGLIPLSSVAAYAETTYHYRPKVVKAIPDSVVDWVLVELRRDTTGSSKAAMQAAFIRNRGEIVDTNGLGPVRFDGIAPGAYRIVIRHRNHLPVMSALPVALSKNSPLYDFTASLTSAYGSKPMFPLEGGVFGLWPGDANRDGNVKFSGARNDRSVLLTAVGLADLTLPKRGYFDADLNLDGGVKFTGAGNDHAILLKAIGMDDLTLGLHSSVPDVDSAGRPLFSAQQEGIPFAREEAEAIVAVPKRFSLSQNYPNPFNPSTTVHFSLAERSMVTLKIFDITGREVMTVVDGEKDAGYHTVSIDGSALSSGAYFYRMTALHGESMFTDIRRFVLLK
ncbi:MAG: T9SS type A sorting domain-containing protein [Acidobacteriota bacterium]